MFPRGVVMRFHKSNDALFFVNKEVQNGEMLLIVNLTTLHLNMLSN